MKDDLERVQDWRQEDFFTTMRDDRSLNLGVAVGSGGKKI